MEIYQEPESMTGMKRYLLGVIVGIVLLLGLSAAVGASPASAGQVGNTDYWINSYTPNLYGGFVPTFYQRGDIDRIYGNRQQRAWVQFEVCLQYEDYPGAGWRNIHCHYYPSQWTDYLSVPPPVQLYADPHNCEWISSWTWGAVLWPGGWQARAENSPAIRLC